MPRVTILNHDRFTDKRTGITFEPTIVGGVYLGVAEVPDDVAREHYASHPCFLVEGLSIPDEPPASPANEGELPVSPEVPASTGEPSTSPASEPAPVVTEPTGRGSSRKKKKDAPAEPETSAPEA